MSEGITFPSLFSRFQTLTSIASRFSGYLVPSTTLGKISFVAGAVFTLLAIAKHKLSKDSSIVHSVETRSYYKLKLNLFFGADPNCLGAQRGVALFKVKVIRELLKSPKVTDETINLVVVIELALGKIEVIKELLKSPKVTGEMINEGLGHVFPLGKIEVIRELLRSPKVTDEMINLGLKKKCVFGEIEELREFLKLSRVTNNMVDSSLTIVLSLEKIEVLRILLKFTKTNINQILLWALKIRHSLETIKELIKNGAKVNTRDINGVTPLHQVCSGFKPSQNISETKKLIRYFMSKGVDLNQKDNFDRTPFHYALNGLYPLSLPTSVKKKIYLF